MSPTKYVCVILSLIARGEIMLCAKVCWWVGRGGFRSLSCCDVFRHRSLILVQGVDRRRR
jgi:hypothetical protein